VSRNGRVSDLPPEIPNVTIRNFLHRCMPMSQPSALSFPGSELSPGERDADEGLVNAVHSVCGLRFDLSALTSEC
jgi:hypothetical protein